MSSCGLCGLWHQNTHTLAEQKPVSHPKLLTSIGRLGRHVAVHGAALASVLHDYFMDF